jgi:cytochrome c-type biogenesis protein CcmH/NrfG
MKTLWVMIVAVMAVWFGAAEASAGWQKDAREALEEGRLDEVETICAEIVDTDRGWTVSRLLLGEARLRSRRWADAEAAFRPVVERTRRDIPSRIGLGKALARQKKVPQAEALFKQVLDLDKKSVVANRELGRLLSPIGRGGEARVFLEKAWRLDPKSIDTAELLLDVHVRGYKDYSSGRKVALGITKAHKKKAIGWLFLADVRMAEGKPEEALKALRKGARAEPKNKEVNGRLADLLLERIDENRRQKRAEEARRHYAAYVELGGDDPERVERYESLGILEEEG